jgi:hypothetical protein
MPTGRALPIGTMLKWFGSDKPDLRNPIRMQDVSEHFRGSGFAIFAKLLEQDGNEVRAIPAPKGPSGEPVGRKFCDRMNAFAQQQGLPGMGYIFWREAEDGSGMEAAGPMAKNIGPERTEAIRVQLGSGKGDAAFFLGGKPETFEPVAGRARNEIGEELGLTDKDSFRFAWIVDFPMYEKTDEGKIDFSHNPFSMPQGGLEALNGDPLEVYAYQYDLACNGYEVISGGIRNHKPEIMYKAFELAGYPNSEVDKRFRRHGQGVQVRRAAPRRLCGGDRPAGDAAGRHPEHPRGHHVPDEPARRGPADERAVRADLAAAAGVEPARGSERELMYQASVPVFRHYLSRISDIVAVAGPDALDAQIADTFSARQQFATAAGFALRITCPLAGREVPDLPQALGAKAGGGAGADFLHLFGLPNFFFHLTMGYAALRAAGVPLGKADFDGFHAYPADFRF